MILSSCAGNPPLVDCGERSTSGLEAKDENCRRRTNHDRFEGGYMRK